MIVDGTVKKLTITACAPTKIDRLDVYTRYESVIVTAVRDSKIRTALRTNQIAGFVTVPSERVSTEK